MIKESYLMNITYVQVSMPLQSGDYCYGIR